MGTIKDRNGKDLTETEEIKKTWQEYMEEPYKKGLNDIDNYNGVVTNLDTLQYEVKWALGSITMNKASGGGGIPAELLKVLKVILLTCCTQYASKLENSAVDTRLEKVSFHSYPKTYSNYHTIALISHVRKVMLKILQARLQQYMS